MKVKVTTTATTWYTTYIDVPDNATKDEIEVLVDDVLSEGDWGNVIDEDIIDVNWGAI